MRKLYQELMSIKQQEKISDKAIMLRMVMMIMVILASLATMSMSAYAFFTCNITSGTNTITAAKFEVEITIEEKGVDLPEGEESTIKSVSPGDAIETVITSATQKQVGDQTTESVSQEDETIIKSVSQGDVIESITKSVTQEKLEEQTAQTASQEKLTETPSEPALQDKEADATDKLIANEALQGESNDLLTRPIIEEEELELTVISTHTVNGSDEYSLSMTGGNVYTITLKPSCNSTAKTGFVIITAVDCDRRYHTQQIEISDDNTEALTFNIEPDGDTTVTFTAYWGTSSYYDDYKTEGDNEDLYITQGEEIMLSINGAEEKQKEKLTIPAKDSKGSKEETMESEAPETQEAVESTVETETVDKSVMPLSEEIQNVSEITVEAEIEAE